MISQITPPLDVTRCRFSKFIVFASKRHNRISNNFIHVDREGHNRTTGVANNKERIWIEYNRLRRRKVQKVLLGLVRGIEI
jgi:hypothetical protein